MAIKLLGSSATTALRHQVGSSAVTNEYGVDVGKVDFIFGDANTALQRRPPRGEPYSGPCKEFNGFFADFSGAARIVGGEAIISVQYKAMNKNWGVQPPERSHELEQRDSNLEFGFTKYQMSNVLIPHPIVTYKFASSQPTSALGSYRTDLRNAPEVDIFTWHSRIPIIEVNPDGSFTLVSVDVVDIKFGPDPSGWFCLKDDNTPCCGGRFFEVEQRWRRALVFFGVQRGSGRQS